jgi:hypothetical protein
MAGCRHTDTRRNGNPTNSEGASGRGVASFEDRKVAHVGCWRLGYVSLVVAATGDQTSAGLLRPSFRRPAYFVLSTKDLARRRKVTTGKADDARKNDE